jgi:hypothetical protein
MKGLLISPFFLIGNVVVRKIFSGTSSVSHIFAPRVHPGFFVSVGYNTVQPFRYLPKPQDR